MIKYTFKLGGTYKPLGFKTVNHLLFNLFFFLLQRKESEQSEDFAQSYRIHQPAARLTDPQ